MISRISFIFLALFATSIYADCTADVPHDHEATHLPVLASAAFTASDVLTLTVTSTAEVVDRVYSFAFLGESGCGADFHAEEDWTLTSDAETCLQTYKFNFNWEDLSEDGSSDPVQKSKCGFSVFENADVIYYNATLLVTQTDTLNQIRGQAVQRQTTSPLVVSVTFPKHASVNTSAINVFAPIKFDGAIIEQSYDVVEGKGKFRLLTSLQYPFGLHATITVISKGDDDDLILTPSLSEEQGTYKCLPTGGDCNQIYDFAISGAICEISGTFQVEFQIVCRGGEPNCPLLGSETGLITWTASSSNLCGVTNGNASLSVALKSYLSDYTTERKGFLLGETPIQRIYLQASSSSDSVSISETFIKSCTIYYQGGSPSPVEILSGGTSAAPATSASYSDYVSASTLTRASIQVHSALFNVPDDQNITVSIGCLIGVEYQNVVHTKRVIIGEGKLPLLKRGGNPTFSTTGYAAQQLVISNQGIDTNPQQPTQQPTSSAPISQPMALFASVLIAGIVLLL